MCEILVDNLSRSERRAAQQAAKKLHNTSLVSYLRNEVRKLIQKGVKDHPDIAQTYNLQDFNERQGAIIDLLSRQGGRSEREIRRVFSWPKDELHQALENLIKEGYIYKQYVHKRINEKKIRKSQIYIVNPHKNKSL